ncbi:MAG: DNA mismatch repair endonuclease MutL [Clostridia bacterium]|nr:DNA mismatch repair endonuclease MutL [Clostridia bacterium]
MAEISVLPKEISELIAAGEVVERPASVIKELVENSIDAGATVVTVEIERGGVTYMRVTDNGCGIEPEDLPTALRRHATSKIKDAEDLDAIMSLGFRGEALAAISSVSNVRIISKTRENPTGAMVESHGGNVVGVTERGASDGTSVIVEDLFFNVPARRKFLKKDITESMAVTAVVEKIALSHPEIAIRFISDGTLRLETSGDGKLMSAIYAVFGRDFAGKMLPLEEGGGDIKVNGYIGRSDASRANRNYQNFFINGRYVKSKTAMAAIEQAYTSYIPPEKFPCCVLFIDIDPRSVDVNVHPSKLEVKFSNEKPVFESIYFAVRSTLEKNISRPEVRLENGHVTAAEYRNMATGKVSADRNYFSDKQKKQNPLSAFVPIEDRSKKGPSQTSFMPSSEKKNTSVGAAYAEFPKVDTVTPEIVAKSEENPSPKSEIAFPIPHVLGEDKFNLSDDRETETNVFPDIKRNFGTEVSPSINSIIDRKINEAAVTPEIRRREILPGEIRPSEKAPKHSGNEEILEIPPYRIVGEAFNSYIFLETEGKLLLIDKHAAHERIIFEGFKKIMKGGENLSQIMMLPIEVTLGREEISSLNEYKAEIESVGFTYGIDENKVSVRAIPVGITADAVPEIFQIFAERLLSGTGNVSLTRDLIFEKALYQASCKAAIKAGRVYSEKDNEWLCKKLMEMPDITVCPHGRPVAIEMTKSMLDKQFERL